MYDGKARHVGAYVNAHINQSANAYKQTRSEKPETTIATNMKTIFSDQHTNFDAIFSGTSKGCEELEFDTKPNRLHNNRNR